MRGVALYVKGQLEFIELCLGTGQEPGKSLRVKISRQTNMGTTVVGICYRLPDQEDIDDAFFRQPEEASCLQALLLMVEILTTVISAGRTMQQGSSNLEEF